ncbi:MAG: tRNA (cytidine(34)-2'-O)-methyltransferase, partial [bacterium]
KNPGRLVSFSTRHSRIYTEFSFKPGDALLFGSETSGLPEKIHQEIEPAHSLTLPMLPGNRSLNLANSVAIAIFEAWRQQKFVGSMAAGDPID